MGRSVFVWRSDVTLERKRYALAPDYDALVDWAKPLRKIVNREDHPGPIRLGLLRIIDPIEWYMRKSEEETRPLLHERLRGAAEGWTAYEPLEPGPSAARAEVTVIDATPPDEPAAEGIDEFARRHDSVRQEHSACFEEKAKALLAGMDAVIETTEGTIRARLMRFRNGAVFENWHTSGHSTGHGTTRIERQHLSDPVGVLVSYLVNAVADLGIDAQPLR